MRKTKYNLDSDEVKQYLQLNKQREAMFYVAGRLFNYEFSEIKDGSVPVFNGDVRNAVDPADAYRAFRGRDADVKALMRNRGFPIAE